MKKNIVTALFVLASLVIVDNAPAQKHELRATIPFTFSAAGTQLPAGSYIIREDGGFTYMIRNDGRRWSFVNTSVVVDNKPQDRKLVFSVYGGQHFLQKILCPSSDMSLEFPPSKAELLVRPVNGL